MKEIIQKIEIANIQLEWIVFTLFVLMCIDVLTGILNAVLEKNVESSKMKKGIVGKIYELCIVAIAIILDVMFNFNCIAKTCCIFYIVQEGLSILENTGQYISYPQIIKNLFVQLKKIGGEKNELD